jgi:cell division protein FtsZ
MGGGTGTGAAPVIAKAARDMGILTVGVVTKPFAFEGNRRAKAADAGIEELQKFVDTLIVIPNQNLFLIANANTTFKEAFQMADEVLQQGVRGITDLMVMPGLINLDFADVRSVMQEMGKAMMGTGEAEGDSRAIEAAQKAIANPLLDGVSMQGAKGVIVSITGGEDMRLLEVDEAANHIRELVDPDANIIWGSAFNPELEGKIRVSVVATGIDSDTTGQAAPDPTRTFSFSMPNRRPDTTIAPVQPAKDAEPVDEPVAAEAADQAPPQEEPVEEPAIEPVADGADDELVLGADTVVSEAPRVFGDDMPPAPAANPSRRRWLSAGAASSDEGADTKAIEPGDAIEPEPVAPAPRVKLGGTLFERMSNVTRGAARDEDESDDKDPLDIPRFLHRQNNQ